MNSQMSLFYNITVANGKVHHIYKINNPTDRCGQVIA